MCVELPEKVQVPPSVDGVLASHNRLPEDASPVEITGSLSSPPKFATPPKPSLQGEHHGIKASMRTKSLGDIRFQHRCATYCEPDSSVAPLLSHRTFMARTKSVGPLHRPHSHPLSLCTQLHRLVSTVDQPLLRRLWKH